MNFKYKILAASLLVLGFASCDRTRHEKGFEYFPDMAHSRTWETYSENPNLPQGMTNQLPPEGSIPRDHTPYPFTADAEGREMAALKLSNPIEKTAINLKNGQEKYRIFCSSCHGEKGDGNGFLFTSGLYNFQPPSLINEKMTQARDGEVFHVITCGWGLMGAHAAQINPDERWKIILYIRNTLQNNTVRE